MKLFKRYKTLLLLVFLVIMAVSISLLGLQWKTAYQHEIAVIQDKFAEHAVNLNSTIKVATDHLNMLRVEAEEDLSFSRLSSTQ
ncbi:MAG: hypothetical protein F6K09_19790, partial [Merismopedia sp. SIO2A8]|nr:hypothetical protein [Merismopedia sp. SIO2A8]